MKPAGEGILSLEYLPASRLGQQSQHWRDSVLGGICFSRPAIRFDAAELPLLSVDMIPPPGGEAICEVWHSREALQSGRHGAIRYRQGDALLFGCLSLEESAAEAPRDAASVAASVASPPLQATTEAAYRKIFELLEARGYPSVLRFWNYFPAINLESHAMERYRQFNVGRQDAFISRGRSVIGNVPAACALGSAAGGLHIAFLASREVAIGIENPRQVSAYNYPSQYGPRSPSFSRAGLVNLAGHDVLFISGTASIVGHQTMHPGDVAAQTRECLQNIAFVVEEANRMSTTADFRLNDLAYTIYVRHTEDMDTVRREIERFIGAPTPTLYMQADVCRADLLVEIEASGGHASSAYGIA
ncbi:MAG: hypothetical protein B7Y41_07430 [Hydrogenophilales bacterium 28-61-23]|nr:MAG: hypothetical protein B7Y41_07430 [Hydrogenophilales bacterium 28-61-23]